MICPKCGYCEEKTEAKKQTDEEFFLEWWTPTIGLESAKESWAEKQVSIGRETAMVMSDIDPYISQVDGSVIESRSKHKAHLKQHRMIELGNDVPKQHKQVDMNTQSKDARKRHIAEQVYQKLNYR
jgi:hypothetical protein